MSGTDFAALLCSRLCHDLVSPVGAIANGLEILNDEHDEAMREQVMAMLEQSARQTANKLKFFRLAFGAAGGFGAQVDPRDAHEALVSIFEGHHIDLDWQVSEPTLEKQVIKLLLNLGLLAGEALIRGGRLSIRYGADAATPNLEITAHGDRVILAESIQKAFDSDAALDQLEPRSAPAILAKKVAQELGLVLQIASLTDSSLSFQVGAT